MVLALKIITRHPLVILVILLRISQEHVVIIYCEIFAIGLTTLLAFDVTKI